MEYRKERLNCAPDALSRISTTHGCCLYSNKAETTIPISLERICEEQHKDPKVEKILIQLAEGDKKIEQDFITFEDKVYRKKQMSENQFHYRLYIPPSLVPEILQVYHDNPLSGHPGIFKTYKRLYEVAYWPGMWTDVKNFLKRCIVCQSESR